MKLAIPLVLLFSASAAALPPGVVRHRSAEAIRWSDAPPSMPKGTRIAVLEGDPAREGMFTVRLRVPAGTKLPPHTHPREERVTVLSGEARIVLGEDPDGPASSVSAGGFYVNPPELAHSVSFPVESLLQLTGSGPWVVRAIGEK